MSEKQIHLVWKEMAIRAHENHDQKLKVLVTTSFGTLAFVDPDSGVEITGFLSSENSIYQYDPNNDPPHDSIPASYGFSIIQTGGGCTAWDQEFILDGNKVHMMLTDDGGITHAIESVDRLLVGVYAGEGTETPILVWEQFNGPLDADTNVPNILDGAPVSPDAAAPTN